MLNKFDFRFINLLPIQFCYGKSRNRQQFPTLQLLGFIDFHSHQTQKMQTLHQMVGNPEIQHTHTHTHAIERRKKIFDSWKTWYGVNMCVCAFFGFIRQLALILRKNYYKYTLYWKPLFECGTKAIMLLLWRWHHQKKVLIQINLKIHTIFEAHPHTHAPDIKQ